MRRGRWTFETSLWHQLSFALKGFQRERPREAWHRFEVTGEAY